MSKQCTTHHFACDCREEKFKQLEEENSALRVRLAILAINSKKQTKELKRENTALRQERDAARKLLGTHILRSDLFSYLAWLEDHRDRGEIDLDGSDYLVLASDGTTCWGKTFMEAVQVAEQHDRKLFDAARKEAQP